MKTHQTVSWVLLGAVFLFGCMKSGDETPLFWVDAEASSTWAMQAACLAADSNPSTFWFPEDEEESCLLVDLSELQSIEQIAFDWYPAQNCAYVVDISADDVHWRTVLTGEVGDSEFSRIVLDEPVVARCLRIRQRGGRKGLAELELNGRSLMDRRYYQQLISGNSTL
jgi:hypothetical protein